MRCAFPKMNSVGFFQPCAGEAVPLKVHTLVVPLLSIGNVPQLCLDLFINTLSIRRRGFITHSSLLPMVSANVFAPGQISLAGEVFEKEGVAWLQLRSAFVRNGIAIFCRDLVGWAASVGVKQVVILGSYDEAWLQRPDIEGGSIKYVCADEEWTRVLRTDLALAPLQWTIDPDSKPSMREAVIAPRTFADSLLGALDALKVRSCALLLFCSEGENIPEAQRLCDALVAFFSKVGLETAVARPNPSWIAPISWAQLLGQVDEATTRQLFQ